MIPKYYASNFSCAPALETKCILKIIAIPQNNIYNVT